MARLPAEINDIIQKYLKALRENHIPVKEAILYGSYATGKYHKWSDIDIALVSDIFVGDRILDKDKIRAITLSISSTIEVMPFSPGDFNEHNPFAKEILKAGVKLV
jgi:uncharacterized protein